MKKIILFSIACFIFFLNSTAQKNLANGYIITLQKDTLHGMINDKNYYHNSVYCDFIETNHDSVQRFFPGEIFGYRYNAGKFYISKVINFEGHDSTLFLEYLMDGELDFYFRQDNLKNNHYYTSKKGSPVIELMYSKKIVTIDGKMYEQENKHYREILSYLTQDHAEISGEIQKLSEPTHKNLINFGEDYHHLACKDSNCIIYNKRIPNRVLFELVGGYKLVTFNREYYRSAGTPLLGFNLYLNNPRFSERSYFGLGFIYEGRSIVDSSGITFTNFKIPVTYGYSASHPGFSPLFQAGVNIRNYEDYIFTSVSLTPGMKYNFKRFFIKAYIDFEFLSIFIIPVAYHSTNFGLGINYKLNY